jgi:hypothetical protein
VCLLVVLCLWTFEKRIIQKLNSDIQTLPARKQQTVNRSLFQRIDIVQKNLKNETLVGWFILLPVAPCNNSKSTGTISPTILLLCTLLISTISSATAIANMPMDEFLNRFDEMGNSFFLRLENMSRNEQILFVLGGVAAVLAYGKMKSGIDKLSLASSVQRAVMLSHISI